MRGLTGGIATGKSTVAGMLAKLGASILDADTIAREVVQPKTVAWEGIRARFPEVIQANLEIDRKKLGQIIFADKAKRLCLEQIIHPQVIQALKERGQALEQQGEIVFADIPLLYETNCQEWLGEIWVVYLDPQTQLQRVMLRDNLDCESAQTRMQAQLSPKTKRQLADVVIDNGGSLEQTWDQVRDNWRERVARAHEFDNDQNAEG